MIAYKLRQTYFNLAEQKNKFHVSSYGIEQNFLWTNINLSAFARRCIISDPLSIYNKHWKATRNLSYIPSTKRLLHNLSYIPSTERQLRNLSYIPSTERQLRNLSYIPSTERQLRNLFCIQFYCLQPLLYPVLLSETWLHV